MSDLLAELAAELSAGTLVPSRDSDIDRLDLAVGSAAPTRKVGRRSRRSFDIWHEVPLIPQLTGMSCWAAAAAMIVGWRERISVEPDHITHGLGAWRAYRHGLLPRDVDSLARAWGLSAEPPGNFCGDDLKHLLEQWGPLWIGEADPGLHVVVIIGLYGDGTPEGTWVRINDPWPIGLGSRYALQLQSLMENFSTAQNLGGAHAQILHVRDPRMSGAASLSSEQEFHEEVVVYRHMR